MFHNLELIKGAQIVLPLSFLLRTNETVAFPLLFLPKHQMRYFLSCQGVKFG